MNPVRMKRDELLTIVRANKDKHVQEYNESVEDYKAAAIQICKNNLKLVNTGDLSKIRKFESLPSPPSMYEDDYSRAIRMFELSVDDIIEIEEDDFRQLVLDEWSWSRNFKMSASTYKTISSR